MARLHTIERSWSGSPAGGSRLHTRRFGVASASARLHKARGPLDDLLPYQLPTAADGLAKTPLPDAAAFDTEYGSLATQAIVDQAALSGTYQDGAFTAPFMNVNAWSGLYFVVGNDQPLVRVKVVNAQTALEFAIGDSGVPIPSGATPQGESGDTDSEAFIYQPDDVRGGGLEGTYYEFWGLNRAHGADLETGYAFTCYQMARVVNANHNIGRPFDYFFQVGASYDLPASDPYAYTDPVRGTVNQSRGVMMYAYWGALAIGANPPGACLMVHPADILRGYCDHPIGLEVANCQSGARWPAQRGDGTYGTDYPVIEGHWFRFAHDATMPTNLTPMGELVWKTVQQYGFIVCDKTATCIAARWAPECGALMLPPETSHDGRDWSGWAWTNFPWADLKLLAVGSDSDYHPTS
jgi:hypothetical protein